MVAVIVNGDMESIIAVVARAISPGMRSRQKSLLKYTAQSGKRAQERRFFILRGTGKEVAKMGWGDAFNLGNTVGQQVERYAATKSSEDYNRMLQEIQRRLVLEGLEAPLIDWEQAERMTERRPAPAPPPLPRDDEDNPLMALLWQGAQLPPPVRRPIYPTEPRHMAVTRLALAGADPRVFFPDYEE